MLNWIRKLFQKSPNVVVVNSPIIGAGEYWAINSDDGSPWPKKYRPVRILEVQGDWVRYEIGSLFPDCRMEAKLFTSIYEKISP